MKILFKILFKLVIFLIISFSLVTNIVNSYYFSNKNYSISDLKIKKFYKSIWINKTYNDIKEEKEKIFNKIVKNHQIEYYLILWLMQQESWINNTNWIWYKLMDFFKINDYFCNKFYWKNIKFKWNDYYQKVAICKILEYLKNHWATKKEINLFLNWKTSYAWAISPVQIMPINLYYYFRDWVLNYKKWELLNFSFYFNIVHKFLFRNDKEKQIVDSLSIDQLANCNNYNSKFKYDYCNTVRKIIARYNRDTNYVNWVINNAVWLFYADRIWINSSFIWKVNNLFDISIIRKFSSTHFWIDLKWIYNKKSDDTNFNTYPIIYNWKYNANCYYLDPIDNNHIKIFKYLRWTIICIDTNKTLYIYSRLNNFKTKKYILKNKKRFNLTTNFKNNYHIIKWILEFFFNEKINNKLKKIYKMKNVKNWEIIWYYWWSRKFNYVHFNYYNFTLQKYINLTRKYIFWINYNFINIEIK